MEGLHPTTICHVTVEEYGSKTIPWLNVDVNNPDDVGL